MGKGKVSPSWRRTIVNRGETITSHVRLKIGKSCSKFWLISACYLKNNFRFFYKTA